MAPEQVLHASTQMSVTNAAGVAFARSLGCELAVLARENSLREIGLIQDAQRAAGKALRERLPREAMSELHLPADRDPVALLRGQDPTRVDALVGDAERRVRTEADRVKGQAESRLAEERARLDAQRAALEKRLRELVRIPGLG